MIAQQILRIIIIPDPDYTARPPPNIALQFVSTRVLLKGIVSTAPSPHPRESMSGTRNACPVHRLWRDSTLDED